MFFSIASCTYVLLIRLTDHSREVDRSYTLPLSSLIFTGPLISQTTERLHVNSILQVGFYVMHEKLNQTSCPYLANFTGLIPSSI